MVWICLGIGMLVYICLTIIAAHRKDRDLAVKAHTFMDLFETVLHIFDAT